jgi:hypothetical protein
LALRQRSSSCAKCPCNVRCRTQQRVRILSSRGVAAITSAAQNLLHVPGRVCAGEGKAERLRIGYREAVRCCLRESHPNREGRMAKKRKKATAKKKTTKRKAKKKGLMAKIMGK